MPEPHPKPRKSSSLHRRINAVIFYSLLLLIVLSPIPFGSNRGWSWSLCALIISMLTLVWVINATSRQANISLSLPPLIIYLFLVPCFWALIQVSTFMPENWYHPLWTKAAEALNTPTQPSIVGGGARSPSSVPPPGRRAHVATSPSIVHPPAAESVEDE